MEGSGGRCAEGVAAEVGQRVRGTQYLADMAHLHRPVPITLVSMLRDGIPCLSIGFHASNKEIFMRQQF